MASEVASPAGAPTTLAPTKPTKAERAGTERLRVAAISANETHPHMNDVRDAPPMPANFARDLPKYKPRQPSGGTPPASTIDALNAMPHNVKVTGAQGKAAERPCALGRPRWPTCYGAEKNP